MCGDEHSLSYAGDACTLVMILLYETMDIEVLV
jgi:hypothetical protein